MVDIRNLARAPLAAAELLLAATAPAWAGSTERVSISSSDEQGNDDSGYSAVALSADGRFVAFGSLASNLVPGDTNGWQDVFVHNRRPGVTKRVSLGPRGVQGNDQSYTPALSADG